MKHTSIAAATTPQLYIDRELGEMLLQLQELRKRFVAYLKAHDDPKEYTPFEEAFDVEGSLGDAMVGISRMIAVRMSDHLFNERSQSDAPAC